MSRFRLESPIRSPRVAFSDVGDRRAGGGAMRRGRGERQQPSDPDNRFHARNMTLFTSALGHMTVEEVEQTLNAARPRGEVRMYHWPPERTDRDTGNLYIAFESHAEAAHFLGHDTHRHGRWAGVRVYWACEESLRVGGDFRNDPKCRDMHERIWRRDTVASATPAAPPAPMPSPPMPSAPAPPPPPPPTVVFLPTLASAPTPSPVSSAETETEMDMPREETRCRALQLSGLTLRHTYETVLALAVHPATIMSIRYVAGNHEARIELRTNQDARAYMASANEALESEGVRSAWCYDACPTYDS